MNKPVIVNCQFFMLFFVLAPTFNIIPLNKYIDTSCTWYQKVVYNFVITYNEDWKNNKLLPMNKKWAVFGYYGHNAMARVHPL